MAEPHHHYAPFEFGDEKVHLDPPCTDDRCPQWLVDFYKAPTAAHEGGR